MSETMNSSVAPQEQEECLLEELDAPVDIEVETPQEQFVTDRPPSPVFVPQQLGVDAQTQTDEDLLFNFDVEVEPVLEVLVGKTLEQSLMEVIEEDLYMEEIMRREESELVRAAELTEAERVEERQNRLEAERERRVAEEAVRVKEEEAVARKVAARGFAHLYVGDVVSNVFGTLQHTGFFYDPLVREIENVTIPWLLDGVAANTAAMQKTERQASALLASAVAEHAQRSADASAEFHRRIQADAAAKEAAIQAAQKEEEDRVRAEEEAAAAEAAAAEGGGEEGGGEAGGEGEGEKNE